MEDEQGVLEVTARLLRESGYEVVEVATAQQAMEMFEAERGRFDLVFTDTILPDGNGLDIIKQRLEHKPDLAVLLGSGYTGDRIHRETISERDIPFVQKPYDLQELLDAIQNALAS